MACCKLNASRRDAILGTVEMGGWEVERATGLQVMLALRAVFQSTPFCSQGTSQSPLAYYFLARSAGDLGIRTVMSTLSSACPRGPLHPPSRYTMASIVRPTLRACQAAPASRLLTTRAPAASIFRLHAPLTRTPVKPSFVRDALPAARFAPFHASASRAILPPLPQRVQGTANDPAPVPPVSATHGSYHWSFERSDSPIHSLGA